MPDKAGGMSHEEWLVMMNNPTENVEEEPQVEKPDSCPPAARRKERCRVTKMRQSAGMKR